MCCIYSHEGRNVDIPLSPPPPTALVDAAIDLFSQLVLEQPLRIQESAFAQLATCISDSAHFRNIGRRNALIANVVTAISKAVPVLIHRSAKRVGGSDRVRSLILDVLQVCTDYNFVANT